jgi:hypothetical protein
VEGMVSGSKRLVMTWKKWPKYFKIFFSPADPVAQKRTRQAIVDSFVGELAKPRPIEWFLNRPIC